MTHPNVIPLTPAPGPRANSKPTPRHGEVLPSPWVMPHHVLVKVEGEVFPNGQPKVAWVPREFVGGGGIWGMRLS